MLVWWGETVFVCTSVCVACGGLSPGGWVLVVWSPGVVLPQAVRGPGLSVWVWVVGSLPRAVCAVNLVLFGPPVCAGGWCLGLTVTRTVP